MATIQSFTKERLLELEGATIVSGEVQADDHLVFTKYDGTTIDMGIVRGGASSIEQTVKNNTGATLTKGTVVYISGSTGDNVLVAKAQANTEATSSKTVGFVSADILNGDTGNVITEGHLSNINTSSASAGDAIWLSPTVPGGVVYGLSNKPVAPNHMVYLGVVVRSQINNGQIYVKIQNGYELNELHNVSLDADASIANNEVLAWDSATSLWKNKTKAEAAIASTTHAATHGSGGTDAITIAPAQVTGTAVITTDSRLSDSRTPTAHKTTHQLGGSDALALDKTQVTGTAVTLADSGTVTNTMLSGSIANNKLANSTITINGNAISLGGSVSTGTEGGLIDGYYALKSGNYYRSNPLADLGGEVVGTANRGYMVPLIVKATSTFDRVAVVVSTAASGSTARIALYGSDTNGEPSTLIGDYGTVSSAIVGVKEITFGSVLTLTPGLYWIAVSCSTVTGLVVVGINSRSRALQDNVGLTAAQLPTSTAFGTDYIWYTTLSSGVFVNPAAPTLLAYSNDVPTAWIRKA